MSVKTITITEDAYRRLKSRKLGDESFSDVILRLAKRRPLSDFGGILRPESADAIRRAIDEDRELRRKVDAHR
jgi:predicted CopG family antitoxin